MLDVNYFLRAIRRETLVIVGTLVNVEDVKDELFDIVKPANPDRITLDDLITCRQGGTGLDVMHRPRSRSCNSFLCAQLLLFLPTGSPSTNTIIRKIN
jgi:hypothetical protein